MQVCAFFFFFLARDAPVIVNQALSWFNLFILLSLCTRMMHFTLIIQNILMLSIPSHLHNGSNHHSFLKILWETLLQYVMVKWGGWITCVFLTLGWITPNRLRGYGLIQVQVVNYYVHFQPLIFYTLKFNFIGTPKSVKTIILIMSGLMIYNPWCHSDVIMDRKCVCGCGWNRSPGCFIFYVKDAIKVVYSIVYITFRFRTPTIRWQVMSHNVRCIVGDILKTQWNKTGWS